jgi:glucokinase
MRELAIGIDLGGTNIKGGVLDRAGRLLRRESIETEGERGREHVIGRVVGLIESLAAACGAQRSALAGVGLGAPGPMSHKAGVIHAAPNLPGWTNVPIRDVDVLVQKTRLSVTLENDANAAAFGEFTAGAGSGVRRMFMMTLGTGVGGGLVIDGRLERGHFDNAGEIGHMILFPNGRPCPCGQRGCFERYASANAVGERLMEALRAGEPSSLAQRAAPPHAPEVLAAARTGDALAARIWRETVEALALGCVNVQHLLNPELIVLAGGLIAAGDALLTPLREAFSRATWRIAPDQPRIEFATLGGDAGVIGAAALAFVESNVAE